MNNNYMPNSPVVDDPASPYYAPYKAESPYGMLPGGSPVEPDMLTTGMQLGAFGATMGLGYAALQRALRLKLGNQAPVSVVKPLMLGALIGSSLGVGAHAVVNKRARQFKRSNWRDLSNNIYSQLYSKGEGPAYKAAMEKEAQLKEVAGIVPYFIPGVGTVMLGRDALVSGGKGLRDIFSGNWGSGLKHLGSGLASGLFAAGSLAGLGGVGKAVGLGARLAAKGGRGAKILARARRMQSATKGLRKARKGNIKQITKGLKRQQAYRSADRATRNKMIEMATARTRALQDSQMSQRLAGMGGFRTMQAGERFGRLLNPALGPKLTGVGRSAINYSHRPGVRRAAGFGLPVMIGTGMVGSSPQPINRTPSVASPHPYARRNYPSHPYNGYLRRFSPRSPYYGRTNLFESGGYI